jgi:hypothetical protein
MDQFLLHRLRWFVIGILGQPLALPAHSWANGEDGCALFLHISAVQSLEIIEWLTS